MKKLNIFHIPLIALVVLSGVLGWKMADGDRVQRLYNKRSSQVGKSIPPFILPDINGKDDFTSLDFRDNKVTLISIFSSWCPSCPKDHQMLGALKRAKPNLEMYGLNYSDKLPAAKLWLNKYGDFFEKTGFDKLGSVAASWGVRATPETFLVDNYGKIIFHFRGALSTDIIETYLLPRI